LLLHGSPGDAKHRPETREKRAPPAITAKPLRGDDDIPWHNKKTREARAFFADLTA
jgi:hypothetical protein